MKNCTKTETYIVNKALLLLGNSKPNKSQTRFMQKLLLNLNINMKLNFDVNLTNRQKECLNYARLGFTSLETAQVLKISKKTVEQHRESAKKRLGCKTIVQAVCNAILNEHMD